jgi:hypothetical protein
MKLEGIRILVLDRGRVKVGRLSLCPDLAFHWLLEDARVIRRWGTTEGLEQIARDGPTADTVLDRPCDCVVPFRAVIEILDTTEELWGSYLTSASAGRPSAPRSRR